MVDEDPNLSVVRNGITSWLEGKGYDLLLVYLLGHGKEGSPGEAYFCLNHKENISPEELGDYILPKEGCRVVFFCDISYARAFVEKLHLKDSWIGVASTNHHKNWFKSKKGILPLFSKLFFSEISLSNSSFGQVYVEAAENDVCINYHIYNWYQDPCILRSNPFGGFKELNFKEIKEELNFHIGGLRASGEDAYLIKTAQAWEEEDNIKVEITVKESAMILPPQTEFITTNMDLISVAFVQDTECPSCWRYVKDKDQTYSMVIINVQQSEEDAPGGNLDRRQIFIAREYQGGEPDIYEKDDEYREAWPIIANNIAQLYTFHTGTDTDWSYFFAHAGHQYDMRANDLKACLFIKLSLTDPNGKIIMDQAGNPVQNPFCNLLWQCPQDGHYYLKAEPASEYPAEGISYMLFLEEYSQVALSFAGFGRSAILGRVVDSNQQGMNGLEVNLVSSGQIMRKT
ncbi:MAG: hypothetical protein ACMUIU_19410 [bacterium]